MNGLSGIKKQIKFLEKDMETWEIHFGNKYIMTVDHDMHGWAGIELAKNLLEEVAVHFDIDFIEDQVDEEN